MDGQLLKDRVAVITGASSGIGEDIAVLFATEGAKVVLVARRREKLEQTRKKTESEAPGSEVLIVPGDVTKTEEIRCVFDETMKQFGKADILVNCAGIDGKKRSIEAVDDEFYDALMDCNLRGAFMCSREAMRIFLKQGSGCILNVGSVNGVRAIADAAYCTAKFGLIGMTKHMAMRTVGTGIRVNVLCPGATLTPMQAANGLANDPNDGWAKVSGALEVPDGDMTNIILAKTNRGVPSTVREISNCALFLVSDLAASIHGQAVVADKGAYL